MTVKDTRTYITVHDRMPENRKIRPLSDKAFRTLFELWCWCSQERNDGKIEARALKTFGTPRARSELISAGLIEPTGDEDGSYQVHDYLEHQRSRAQIEELSQKRAEAGKRGGRPAKAKQPETKLVSKTEAKKTHLHLQQIDDLNPSSQRSLRSDTPPEDEPVDNSLFGIIIGTAAEAGITLHPLVVPDVIAFIDSRRGPRAKPVEVPTRYYPGVMRRSWAEVEQFIHDRGLAS